MRLGTQNGGRWDGWVYEGKSITRRAHWCTKWGTEPSKTAALDLLYFPSIQSLCEDSSGCVLLNFMTKKYLTYLITSFARSGGSAN